MALNKKLHVIMNKPPRRFQVSGVRFAQRHGGRILLGDDMGLGKTYQAIAYAAINPDTRPIVVVCPATVKYRWADEFMIMARMETQVLEGYKQFGLWFTDKNKTKSRWFNSTKKRQEWAKKNAAKYNEFTFLKKPPPTLTSHILVVNYTILDDWMSTFLKLKPKLVVFDECHYLKDRKTIRTKNCKKLSRIAPHVLSLSGTPVMNRPAELFPTLNMLYPKRWNSFWDFAFKYCDPKPGFRGRGWDFTGASNLDELHEELSTVMIRRLKKDVLKDLPTKQKTIIPVDITNRATYDSASNDFVKWLIRNKGLAAAKKTMGAETLVQLGVLKRLAALGKLPHIYKWVDNLLENTNEKLVIFAVHRRIISALFEKYPRALVIDGGTPPKQRREIEKQFDTIPERRLIIANIKAGGIGLTLTAASKVLFTELGWTPTEHEQAEDRIARIGQEASSINVYYLIGKNTIEEHILSLLEQKENIIQQVIEGTQPDSNLNIFQIFLASIQTSK